MGPNITAKQVSDIVSGMPDAMSQEEIMALFMTIMDAYDMLTNLPIIAASLIQAQLNQNGMAKLPSSADLSDDEREDIMQRFEKNNSSGVYLIVTADSSPLVGYASASDYESFLDGVGETVIRRSWRQAEQRRDH